MNAALCRVSPRARPTEAPRSLRPCLTPPKSDAELAEPRFLSEAAVALACAPQHFSQLGASHIMRVAQLGSTNAALYLCNDAGQVIETPRGCVRWSGVPRPVASPAAACPPPATASSPPYTAAAPACSPPSLPSPFITSARSCRSSRKPCQPHPDPASACVCCWKQPLLALGTLISERWWWPKTGRCGTLAHGSMPKPAWRHPCKHTASSV